MRQVVLLPKAQDREWVRSIEVMFWVLLCFQGIIHSSLYFVFFLLSDCELKTLILQVMSFSSIAIASINERTLILKCLWRTLSLTMSLVEEGS